MIGQVARLPLKPSEANALLPLYEAVSNSLHAIHDRFGDRLVNEKGRIDIEIIRSESDGDKLGDVVGFHIKDNGVGLNAENYKSFCTPYSRFKMSKGGKGVGRLGWFKIFEKISLDSTYSNGEGIEQIAFDFVLKEKDQIQPKSPTIEVPTDTGTQVVLENYISPYGTRCPSKPDTIIQRLIGHFLPVFAAEHAPKIIYHDDDGITDLKEMFASKIVQSEEKIIEIEIEGQIQPIIVTHMRCDKSIRPRGGQNNWLCFCANSRGVKEYAIDEQIGLKLLKGDHIYVGTVVGDYLDSHVNPQRTDFTFETEDGRTIRRQVANSVKEFLKLDVDDALAQKKSMTTNVIKKNPQYLYVTSNIDEFVSGLQPNSTTEEAIYVEMAQDRYRRQRRFNGVKREIDSAENYDAAISKKVEDYKKYMLDDQKGALAEYVTKRKAVLDLLDTLRGFADVESEKQHLEEAVHRLICPMRVDSDALEIEEHNLWILDDRLAFYRFFASDRPISQYTESDSGREPDIAFFYDSCIAWRESERSCDTVILVEFKRPGLEHYSDKNDPLMQLMDYVTLFKSGKTVRDRKGNVISGVGNSTAYHCFIVADVTEGLKKRLRGRFDPTPDGKGLFGYTRNPDTYIEVIPYDKLLLARIIHERAQDCWRA